MLSRSWPVLMDGWQSRSSPVEYWFFRTSWEGGALLVDFIRRRDEEHGEIRVASAHGGMGRVDHAVAPRDRVPGGADEECLLDEHRSRGAVVVRQDGLSDGRLVADGAAASGPVLI